ncbi:hypothetical protein RQP46_005473 [Phenoliferia psychrophenolica]
MSAFSSPSASTFAPSLFASTASGSSAYSDSSNSDSSSEPISAPPSPPPSSFHPLRTTPFFPTYTISHMDVDRPEKRRKPDRTDRCDEDEDDEAEISRLHHLAFEQLRRETDRDSEGFVERLRRWEDSRRTAAAATCCDDSVGLGLVLDNRFSNGPPARPSSPVSAEDEDEDDDLEVTLSPLPSQTAQSRPAGPPPPLEIADLVARLSAEGLDDFSAVREYQDRRS